MPGSDLGRLSGRGQAQHDNGKGSARPDGNGVTAGYVTDLDEILRLRCAPLRMTSRGAGRWSMTEGTGAWRMTDGAATLRVWVEEK